MRTNKTRGIVYTQPRKELDPDVALLLGLHAGDGWLSDKWGISCRPDDKAMFLHIIDLVRNILGVEPIKPVKCPAGKAIMIRSGQPQALAFFRSYGFPQGRKTGTVQVPTQILESNDKGVVKAFLCGLFSTDGCFSFQVNRGPRVEIQVKSKKLRDGFICLASKLGFSFRAYAYLPPRGKNKSPLQVAYTTQTNQVVRWMEEIGSIKDAHIKRYQDWKTINRMSS
ncbi:MAG: LAGLIDADG family homing endonuclease [Candidatus Bathyarchaeia archaeon]